MNRTRKRALLLALPLALALAACGGGDDDSAADTTAPAATVAPATVAPATTAPAEKPENTDTTEVTATSDGIGGRTFFGHTNDLGLPTDVRYTLAIDPVRPSSVSYWQDDGSYGVGDTPTSLGAASPSAVAKPRPRPRVAPVTTAT